MTLTDDFVPRKRSGTVVRRFGPESIVWASEGPGPIRLDPVAAILFEIADGAASVGDLVEDVHSVVGVSRSDARFHIARTVQDLALAGLLEGFEPRQGIANDYFPFPPST